MTERINGNGFRPVDTGTTRRTETAKAADGSASDSAASSSAASGDTVNLTRSGLLMSKLEELVHSAPVVDINRVRTIKDALAAGSYQVDDQRVADNMMRLDRELLA